MPNRATADVSVPTPEDTARLRFRPMTHDDLDLMAALLSDPDVMAYYPAPKTRDEAAAWIEWARRSYAEHGHGLWVIETHDGTFVGDCGLTVQPVYDTTMLEVGYHVTPALQGRGLATEAAAACRDFARDVLHEDELIALIHPDNRTSSRVAKNIGMTRGADDVSPSGITRSVYRMAL